MITFLWMLYLAFTLALSFRGIVNIGFLIKYNHSKNGNYSDFVTLFVPALLWAIWYMYFLH